MTSPRTSEFPIDAQFIDRWSPRAFTGEAIDTATLMGFFEAARWAPSASNLQPWRFLYGHAGSTAFETILGGLVPFNQGWAKSASALIVVLSCKTSVAPGATQAKPNPWHAFDAGSAWMSLALQAHHAGWATHGMGGFVADTLAAGLNLPDDVQIHCVVAVGKPGDKASLPEGLQAREAPNDRVPLAQLVAEGAYRFGA